jgi:hypothetical protein
MIATGKFAEVDDSKVWLVLAGAESFGATATGRCSLNHQYFPPVEGVIAPL